MLPRAVSPGGRTFPAGSTLDTGLDVVPGSLVPLGMRVKKRGWRLEAAVFRQTGTSPLDEGLPPGVEAVKTRDGRQVRLPEAKAFEERVEADLLAWPPSQFDSTADLVNNPSKIPDVWTFGDHPYGWNTTLNNNVHAVNSDTLSDWELMGDLIGVDPEMYLALALRNAPFRWREADRPSARLLAGRPLGHSGGRPERAHGGRHGRPVRRGPERALGLPEPHHAAPLRDGVAPRVASRGAPGVRARRVRLLPPRTVLHRQPPHPGGPGGDPALAVAAGALDVQPDGSFTVVDEEALGLPGTLLQGRLADPAGSLRALVDRKLREQVVAANKKAPELARAQAEGTGHPYWVDAGAGFTPHEQRVLVAFLLSLTRPEPPAAAERIPGAAQAGPDGGERSTRPAASTSQP